MSDTIGRLKEMMITRLKLKVTADDITDDTRLFGPDSLDLDSIDVLELVIGIKKEFGVEIADRETAEKIFISIGTIVKYIEDKR